MKYTDSALNIAAALTCSAVGNAWIVKNLKGNESDEEMVNLIKIKTKNKTLTLQEFQNKKYEVAQKLDSLGNFIDGCVGLFDEKFPKYDVQNITNGEKPVFLTYKGDLDLLDKRHLKVTVIGLLNPTSDIENLESKIVSKMVDNSAIILSGLANGCDSVAHKATLNRGGATVAFLPSTLKNILPKENLELAKEIVISGGLLVSEYYEDVEVTNRFSLNALSDRYIKRDRLQALFSDMVCLAASYSKDDSFENGKKTNKDSGSRHALEKALKWGIARAAMYGDDELFKEQMFNLNREIIKDGARIIDLDNVADILEEIKNKKVKKGSESLLF